MKIAIVTDAWFPQVNGVVRTLDRTRAELIALGHDVRMIAPDAFRTVPCPTYPEIRLALWPFTGVRRALDAFQPEAIHIATEGPLGLAARRYALKRGFPFTTAFHTKFPEYVHARFRIPVRFSYAIMRWFHGRSAGVMVATETIRAELAGWGIGNVKMWTRGVDTELFHPRGSDEVPDALRSLARPIFVFVGRVAVEKNIGAFLALTLPGTKLIVGDGPMRADLAARHPDAVFVGAKHGEDLARHFAAADVFVFPSRTDTFGLVLLEAMASGLPVAAYPVPGPLDVVGRDGHVGVLDEDLAKAAHAALAVPRERCVAYARGFSWRRTAEIFFANLAPFSRQPAGTAPLAAVPSPVQP